MTSHKPKKIKNVAQHLLSTGLLFEINRLVLNKFSLSLQVDLKFDEEDEDEPPKVVFDALYDYSDCDDEGVLFDEESFEVGNGAYSKYLEEVGNERLKKREEALGFIIQEKPEE